MIKINTEKAKGMGVLRMRAARKLKLGALDIEIKEAQLSGSNLTGLSARRTALLNSTEVLKNLVPESETITLEEIASVITPLTVLPE